MKNLGERQNISNLPGFEPGIFWSVVRRVIHCATGPIILTRSWLLVLSWFLYIPYIIRLDKPCTNRSQRNWTIPAKTHTAVCRCQWGSQSIPGSGPWVLENFFSDFSHHNFALWTYLMENYVPRIVWTFHDEHGQGTVALLTLLWTGWGISSNGRALA